MKAVVKTSEFCDIYCTVDEMSLALKWCEQEGRDVVTNSKNLNGNGYLIRTIKTIEEERKYNLKLDEPEYSECHDQATDEGPPSWPEIGCSHKILKRSLFWRIKHRLWLWRFNRTARKYGNKEHQ